MTIKKILVVDDEAAILTLLQYNLEKEHYQVTTSTDGLSAYRLAATGNYDFIILDLMLPGIDGLEITRRLRQDKINTPIMILTAKDSETDKIVGLELGADDYVTKPFSPREIIARIKAIDRRFQAVQASDTANKALKIGELTIDVQNFHVKRAEKSIQLTPKEFELLVFFVKHANQTLSRESLLNGVWGFEYPAETRMVDIQVSHLREKIEIDSKNPEYLQTMRGFGYRFMVPDHEA